MNDNLKRLMLEAGYAAPELAGRAIKLAELVVTECANFTDYAEELYKHFGVEEHTGWVCPRCGVDRTRAACPRGHTAALTGECPMIGVAQ